MTIQTITEEITIEDCLQGIPKDASDLDDEAIQTFVDSYKQDVRDDIVSSIAAQQRNPDLLPEASRLFWEGPITVWACCEACYRERSDEEWTGSVDDRLQYSKRRAAQQRIEDGAPCTLCKRERLQELREEIADGVEIEVVVVDNSQSASS